MKFPWKKRDAGSAIEAVGQQTFTLPQHGATITQTTRRDGSVNWVSKTHAGTVSVSARPGNDSDGSSVIVRTTPPRNRGLGVTITIKEMPVVDGYEISHGIQAHIIAEAPHRSKGVFVPPWAACDDTLKTSDSSAVQCLRDIRAAQSPDAIRIHVDKLFLNEGFNKEIDTVLTGLQRRIPAQTGLRIPSVSEVIGRAYAVLGIWQNRFELDPSSVEGWHLPGVGSALEQSAVER